VLRVAYRREQQDSQLPQVPQGHPANSSGIPAFPDAGEHAVSGRIERRTTCPHDSRRPAATRAAHVRATGASATCTPPTHRSAPQTNDAPRLRSAATTDAGNGCGAGIWQNIRCARTASSKACAARAESRWTTSSRSRCGPTCGWTRTTCGRSAAFITGARPKGTAINMGHEGPVGGLAQSWQAAQKYHAAPIRIIPRNWAGGYPTDAWA
jgi:hypothetical protein